MSKVRFSKRKLHFLFLSFYVAARETEQRKKTNKIEKRPQNPIEIVFLKWSSKNEKCKKNVFNKKLPDTICVRKGEKCIFVHTICFGQKIVLAQNSENQEKL